MGCTSSLSTKTENDTNATNLISNALSQVDLAASAAVEDVSMTSKLQLSLSCEGLQNTDRGSLSDTFAVISLRSKNQDRWVEAGRTEIIANSLMPKWVQMIPVIYRFEEIQNIQVSVYNVKGEFTSSDASPLHINDQIFQGSVETTLAHLVGSHQQTYTAPIMNVSLPAQNATLTIKAEELANQNSKICLQLSGSEMPSGSFFLLFSYLTETQSLFPCFRTEVCFKTKNPNWNKIEGSLQNFVNGDTHRPVVIDCMVYKSNGQHVPFGRCETSVEQLKNTATSTDSHLPLFKEQTIVGKLKVNLCEVVQEPTFFDYISSGTELAFIAAIDFTASNGNPISSESLHYIDPSGKLNSYASAISGVGHILEYYDDDNLFPVYGFGAEYKNDTKNHVMHSFAVNGNEQDPNCKGVQGILDSYQSCLRNITLKGPTYFAPIINQCAATARSTLSKDPSNQTYFVLLIITDGKIMDMENTTEAIVDASDLPLSIIILGVGNADFSSMEVLDGDDVRLHTSAGRYAKRDVVQFVPMAQFQNAASFEIAKEVLDEVPRQLVDYMLEKNIIPIK